jgi:hypothetical protein
MFLKAVKLKHLNWANRRQQLGFARKFVQKPFLRANSLKLRG